MANELIADFIKRFPGTIIHGQLNQPALGHSVTVLFGPSGCGKTTVLRCLAGLETPDSGVIRFGADTWFDPDRGINLTPQQRNIGFVFQDYALFPHLNVANNVGYGLGELSSGERRQRVDALLERFELTAHAQQRPRQLSGGQQQRVALARTLACRPKLLLLDEPLSALDTALREQLRSELRRSLAACEVPVLLVTHDREEALALGDHLVVMLNGSVRQSGPVLDVFNRPSDPDVARIVRVENVQPGRIVSVNSGLATIEVGGARLIALPPPDDNPDVFVCIRGEDVMLFKEASGPGSPRNHLPGNIQSISREGPMMRIHLDCGFPLTALLTRQACDELALKPDDHITALIKAPNVHLIPRRAPAKPEAR